MTVDERIEKLTERHEALTQSLELLTLDVRELTATFKQSYTAIGESLRDLIAVARAHETRIANLEES